MIQITFLLTKKDDVTKITIVVRTNSVSHSSRGSEKQHEIEKLIFAVTLGNTELLRLTNTLFSVGLLQRFVHPVW